MRSLAQKMKKLCPVEFSRKSFKSQKSMKLTKEIVGEQIFKLPAFGLRCTDFAKKNFKVTLLQSTKSQEVSEYLFYLKNWAIVCRKKCGSLGLPPHKKFGLELHPFNSWCFLFSAKRLSWLLTWNHRFYCELLKLISAVLKTNNGGAVNQLMPAWRHWTWLIVVHIANDAIDSKESWNKEISIEQIFFCMIEGKINKNYVF